MFELIGLIAASASAILGYAQSRRFVRQRLAYVDAVQRAGVPAVAGVAAGVVALPVVAVLPLVGLGTAILFGGGVGAGVAAGVRDIRRRLPGLR